MQPNHRSTKAVANKTQVEVSNYQGLIPDPESLRKLEELIPNAGERWMALAESEIKARQINDSIIVKTYRFSVVFGSIAAILTSILILGISVYMISLGHVQTAAWLIAGSLTSTIIAWLTRRRSKEKLKP